MHSDDGIGLMGAALYRAARRPVAPRGPSLAEGLRTLGARQAARSWRHIRAGGATAGARFGAIGLAALVTIRCRPWMPHAAVALLLAPVAVTWAGANLLTVMETRHVTQVRQSATARLEASTQARAIEAARVRIAPWFTAPTIGALTTPIAGVLPDDVELSDIEVSGKALTLTLATADPDTLRAALRNDPILGALHEIDQAAGSDGRMRVTLRGLVR